MFALLFIFLSTLSLNKIIVYVVFMYRLLLFIKLVINYVGKSCKSLRSSDIFHFTRNYNFFFIGGCQK